MANTAQAKKRARQAEQHRQRNVSLRSSLRTQIKKVRKAIETGNKADATATYLITQPVIDSMVTKGIIEKNTAARYKSRLNSQIKKLA